LCQRALTKIKGFNEISVNLY